MSNGFTGFSPDTLEFFAGIRFNNNAEWYNDHKGEFEEHVMAPLRALTEALAPALKEIDPRIDARAGRSISRIRRDTRFTKDKAPYRDHMWMTHRRHDQTSSESLAFWFEISLSGYRYGLGMYGGLKPVMDAVRLDLRDHPERWEKELAKLADIHVEGENYARLSIPEHLSPLAAAMYRKKGFYYELKGQSLERAMTPLLFDDVLSGYKRLARVYQLTMDAYDRGRPVY